MYKKFLAISTVSILCCILIFGPLMSLTDLFAQTDISTAVSDREAQLRAELAQVLEQIKAQQQNLVSEQQKGASIQRDVNILTGQINEAKLKIRARNLAIAALGKDITTKTKTINTLTGRIEDSQQSLAQLIRKTNEIDSYSLADVVLSDKSLSDFFRRCGRL
jgi:peptidoglycan hydrolase CwlO-like protein